MCTIQISLKYWGLGLPHKLVRLSIWTNFWLSDIIHLIWAIVSIRNAENIHVLTIHDYAGNAKGLHFTAAVILQCSASIRNLILKQSLMQSKNISAFLKVLWKVLENLNVYLQISLCSARGKKWRSWNSSPNLSRRLWYTHSK